MYFTLFYIYKKLLNKYEIRDTSIINIIYLNSEFNYIIFYL